MKIERLNSQDAERLRALRLRALQDAPHAFATTFAEAAALPWMAWEFQLTRLATFVASLDGHDVGLVRGSPDDQATDTGWVISMWVAPEARRQGLGSKLIDAVIDWARAEKLQRLLLDVAEENSPAIALYLQKGFVPNGTTGSLPPPREHIREIQLELRF